MDENKNKVKKEREEEEEEEKEEEKNHLLRSDIRINNRRGRQEGRP